MNTSTREPGQLVYEAACTVERTEFITPWRNLDTLTQEACAAAEQAVRNDAQQRDVEGAVQLLMNVCHDAAKSWWIDTETGEDVRDWPAKFFKLWVASKLMLCVTELAEAMEGHRKNAPDDKLPHFEMFTVEGADALIRICDLYGGLGKPMARAVVEKLAFNATRADHKIENRVAVGGKSI